MTTTKNKSVFELITRLNQLMKEETELDLKYIKSTKEHGLAKEKLVKEYDEIIMELWGCIPSLKDDVNIQPKKRVRKYEDNRFTKRITT